MQVAEACVPRQKGRWRCTPVDRAVGIRRRRVAGCYLVAGVAILHQDNN